MQNDNFGGHKKSGKWILQNLEDARVRPLLLALVPRSVETHHLTLMTLIWSVGVVIFAYLGQFNASWLWGVTLMIIFQYTTDLLDGAVGRARNTGLVKWGYYMDHFLDYVFFSSLILGYTFIFPSDVRYLFVLTALIQIGFMVNLFLSFSVTNEFRISFLNMGPTETRLAYILFNTFIIFFGTGLLATLMPYFATVLAVLLCTFVYSTQKKIWLIDMGNKG